MILQAGASLQDMRGAEAFLRLHYESLPLYYAVPCIVIFFTAGISRATDAAFSRVPLQVRLSPVNIFLLRHITQMRALPAGAFAATPPDLRYHGGAAGKSCFALMRPPISREEAWRICGVFQPERALPQRKMPVHVAILSAL